MFYFKEIHDHCLGTNHSKHQLISGGCYLHVSHYYSLRRLIPHINIFVLLICHYQELFKYRDLSQSSDMPKFIGFTIESCLFEKDASNVK